ncbi:hypothetical protein BU25DRAFT_480778 [Macroventuria anomochaeta]|uniref:Uncharacterized protein n=1 Tax=Macroventuria anomochaeta TaxID=301207 RepID=A0ACB6RK35_9PLEO|nr:uncharacterized protein BU25DRAFT_480778 [Macroventuria anomochaeta]KAF2622231.1 hypothetical protein BU25DRAFT_480778 [Macroventuria anomochaeta]
MDFGVSGRTLKCHMGSMDWHKCVACSKGWVSKRNAENHVLYSETMLVPKLEPEDWCNVRFPDEVHWHVGPQGKMRILRKPGERYCADYIQEQITRNDKKNWEAAHTWAAVGYNFKSDLTFYNTIGNKNGKLSLPVYRDQILEPMVLPWLKRGDNFILAEDNNSGHGGGSANNIVAMRK